ncbi:hypothetical protein AB1462_19635 [Pseudomonas sp. SB113]|uniref:hypothetical protein n=1 Tax=unclassified Pseudomonas TaxID=196821 RepID=UPI0012B6CD82|nr:hypothetical protein [Pseudomonas sp. SH10-3B]MBY8945154.1 hypothetical protein [Pseudomonas sp. SH10-3B]
MGTHSKKEVERLLQRLQERHEALEKVMRGRDAIKLSDKEAPGLVVSAEDIRFAVDDVATALKEIKARLGKG